MPEVRSNVDVVPCGAVVMPVYSEEEGTVAEVVRAVLAQRPAQQLIIVYGCSNDGTWAKLQQIALIETRILLTRHSVNEGKGVRCALELRKPWQTLSSFRMRSWNMIPRNITCCLGRSSLRRRMSFMGPGLRRNWRPSRVVFLAFCWEQFSYDVLQHGDKSQSDRHGNLLQDLPSRGYSKRPDRRGHVRVRTGDHGQACAKPAHLRSWNFVQRPHVR